MRKSKWLSLSTKAFFWLWLFLPVHSIRNSLQIATRRIQNSPAQRIKPWLRDYDNIDDGGHDHDDDEQLMVGSQQRLRPVYYRRPPSLIPPSTGHQYPQSFSFNGDFHIGRDQFVSFKVGDAVRGPQPSELRHPDYGSFRPPDKMISFVNPIGIPTRENRNRPGVMFTPTGQPSDANTGYNDEQKSLYYIPPETKKTTPLTTSAVDFLTVSETEATVVFETPESPTVPEPRGRFRQNDYKETRYLTRNVSERVVINEGDVLKDAAWEPVAKEEYSQRQPGDESNWEQEEWAGPKIQQTTTRTSILDHLMATGNPLEALKEGHYPTDQGVDVERQWAPSLSPTYNQPDSGPLLLGPSTRGGPQSPRFIENREVDERFETTVAPILFPEVSSKTPITGKDQRGSGPRLSTGAIAGIAIGILAPLTLVAGAVAFFLYGRHLKAGGPKGETRAIAERACNYIDDSVRVSGIMNSHIELPKENSEEMTSLDNDSFLNSLEAVTIQNYWAETAKNTKV